MRYAFSYYKWVPLHQSENSYEENKNSKGEILSLIKASQIYQVQVQKIKKNIIPLHDKFIVELPDSVYIIRAGSALLCLLQSA